MKEFEKIELLLKSKDYDELTQAERAIVDQELNQEVYEELRLGMAKLSGEQLKVRKDIKRSLMSEFKQTEKRGVFALINFRLPAYTHLVPLLAIIYLIFFLPSKETVVTQDRIVEVMVRDTIQVTQVDTLLVERIVNVPTPVYVTQKVESEEKPEVVQVSNRSLSEQKEVLDLVVRGLE